MYPLLIRERKKEVLSDITFRAKKGETVAFIGSTGSGKSTLVNLIPRFFDVTAGTIRVDGVDVRNMDLKDLRSYRLRSSKGCAVFGNDSFRPAVWTGRCFQEEIRKAARIAAGAGIYRYGKKRVWTVRSPRRK